MNARRIMRDLYATVPLPIWFLLTFVAASFGAIEVALPLFLFVNLNIRKDSIRAFFVATFLVGLCLSI